MHICIGGPMKTLRILGIILIVFFLIGCQKKPEDSEIDRSDMINDEAHIIEKEILHIIDHVDDVSLERDHLSIYEDDRYPGIPYVDIEAFLGLLSPAINNYSIEKTSRITISTPLYAGDGSNAIDEYALSIEPTLNKLMYSDFNFYLALSSVENTTYETDLEMVDFEIEGDQPGLTIDLSLYDIDILYANDTFYLPLDVANLVLTSYSLNVYRIDDDLYVFDDVEKLLQQVGETPLSSQEEDEPLINYSYRFSALLFDYFYGLKSYLSVDSYLDKFSEAKLDETLSFTQYSNQFQKEIFAMDDLHTQILDYGLDREDTRITNLPLPYSRLVLYTEEYIKHCYRNETESFKWTEYGDYYLLELNAFTSDLKDQLKNTLGRANPDKVIYIDLTCNLGGDVFSVVELLAYMTSDPITLSYLNATTGVVYHETYQASTSKKVDNSFIILTTKATYSAANLFTSLVKDMKLGLVVGRPTSGGAATVRTTVLPNSMLMTYSTPMVFINQQGQIIEQGILPHVEFSSFYNRDQYITETKDLYKDTAVYTIDDETTLEHFKLSIDTSDYISDLHLNSYTFEFIDGLTNRILYTTQSDSLDVTIDHLYPNTLPLIKIKVYADYTYHTIELSELIYVGFADELPDSISDDTVTIDMGQTYLTTKHNAEDVDYVRIIITEPDAYLISTFSGSKQATDSRVYDDMGELVGWGTIVNLEPGVYYIQPDLDDLYFNYSIRIDRLYDDNVDGTRVTMTEGVNDVSLNYDYDGDKEWIIFTLNETMRIMIYSDMYISSNYYLTDASGVEYFHPNSKYLSVSSRQDILFEKGTYMMKFHQQVGADMIYTILFNAVLVTGDKPGDVTLDHKPYESLVPGMMTVMFEGKWDKDIYQFTTDQVADLQFLREGQVTVCQVISPTERLCKWADQLFSVEPGTHYFIFEALSNEITYSIDIHVIVLQDLSNENHMIPIEIGVAFDVFIEKDGDIDYYTFDVFELTFINVTIENGHPSTAAIYDDADELIYTIRYGRGIVQLLPGSYVLEIGENIYHADEVYHFIVTLSILETSDADPNFDNFPLEYYREFTLPINYDNRIIGTIDYENDMDWIIIHVTQDQTFTFSVSNSTLLICYLYDSEGNRTRIFNNNNYDLTVGMYYLNIFATSQYTVNLPYFVIFS